jgi:gas vesicle protein
MTFKQKFTANILIGAALGALLGRSSESLPNMHAKMYAAAGAAIGGAATVYLTDSAQEETRLRAEIVKIQADLEQATKPQVEATTSGLMNSKVPEKYKAMINPGEWVVYNMDQWIEDSENHLIHQDKMMELTPPSLKAQTLPAKTKGKQK